ncbi:MAG: TIGR00282 family metallophosphoesterase [Rhodospirillaceae bacterium]|nr:TIGR00282 family metallophosphoesterase [Rhodospirillaceae bacterium]
MKLLFLGDVVGKVAREKVINSIPMLRDKLSLDIVIVNGENAAGGFGITSEICKQFFDSGIDVITGGNHSWDQSGIIEYIEKEPRLLRPLNHVKGTPGRGYYFYNTFDGKKILIINLIGQVFMKPIENPFLSVDDCLKSSNLGKTVDLIFVDFHAEATSEKMAMAQFLDGRVSAVIGSHQQIPTADSQILDKGTAYQTDAGMCGDYNSVIGMQKDVPINRFLGKISKDRFRPAGGDATICGVVIETSEETGLAKKITPLRLGGRLNEEWPT